MDWSRYAAFGHKLMFTARVRTVPENDLSLCKGAEVGIIADSYGTASVIVVHAFFPQSLQFGLSDPLQGHFHQLPVIGYEICDQAYQICDEPHAEKGSSKDKRLDMAISGTLEVEKQKTHNGKNPADR